jgi:hypothetical protein
MSAHQALFPVTLMTRVLGVSESGFHVWRQRQPSAQAIDTSLRGLTPQRVRSPVQDGPQPERIWL